MKFKITIIVEGGPELERDLQKGYVQDAIDKDVFQSNESVVSLQYERVEE